MRKLLALDDDRHLVDLMSQALSPHGYDVVGAHKVSGTFETIKREKPEVAVLDVMLPDGAGYQVSRSIRRDPELYKMPVLLMSSLAEPPEVNYGILQGADAYLTKPFTLEQLLDRLGRLDALQRRIEQRSEGTNLFSLEAMEREIDHLIFRGEPFSLCYLTLNNFDAFLVGKGKEGADKVITWVADSMRRNIRDLKHSGTRIGHLGRDQFLVLLDPQHVEEFCAGVTFDFERKGSEFYKDFEVDSGYVVVTKHRGTYSGHGLMKPQIDVATWSKGNFQSAHDMLHELRQSHQRTESKQHKTLFRYEQDKKW